MITIIPFLQLPASIFVRHLLIFRQLTNFRFQIMMDFLFCNSTQLHIRFVHRDIVQIIQVTKHTYLTKLGNSRQKGKADIPVHRFQHRIKTFQCITILLSQLLITDSLQHRFIIFINQNHHPLPRLFTGTLYNTLKTQRNRSFRRSSPVHHFPFSQRIVQYSIQAFGRIILFGVQIQM